MGTLDLMFTAPIVQLVCSAEDPPLIRNQFDFFIPTINILGLNRRWGVRRVCVGGGAGLRDMYS